MKSYIIDANVLFGALISGKQIYVEIFERHRFFAPDFINNEVAAYKTLILKKTKLEPIAFHDFINKLFQNLLIIPASNIMEAHLQRAIELCKDIDPKDTMYVALALEMKLTLITRDVLLYEGLLKKDFTNVILFDSFFKSFIEA